jgi:DNA-binding transcriptional ArsR family regulator
MIEQSRMIETVTTRNEDFQPEEYYTISSLETLKVISDPTRLHMLETLAEGPMTVKQVARELGTSPTKLYYHINLLEEHGLIVVTGSRIVSGIIEKQYRTRAYNVKIDRALLNIGGGGENNESLDALLSVIFDSSRDDVRQGINNGTIKLSQDDEGRDSNAILMRSIAFLTPEQFNEYYARFRELFAEMSKAADEHLKNKRVPGARRYGLTVAFYPTFEGNQDDIEL